MWNTEEDVAEEDPKEMIIKNLIHHGNSFE